MPDASLGIRRRSGEVRAGRRSAPVNSALYRAELREASGRFGEALDGSSAPDSNAPSGVEARPRANGKFLFVGEQKLYVQGATYGTFRPDAEGHEFPARDVVSRDFEMMAASNVNAVRTYTPPPVWLLDEAQRHGLRVMVGLAAERYVGYLNDGRRPAEIARMVCERVGACWGHPGVLCYA